MRNIRVKQQNQTAVIQALQAAGFEAKPSDTPVSETTWNQVSFLNWEDQQELIATDTKNFTGVETSASGHQAHKIIVQLRQQGSIK